MRRGRQELRANKLSEDQKDLGVNGKRTSEPYEAESGEGKVWRDPEVFH